MTLRHLVLLRFKPSVSSTDIAAIERAFCALRQQTGSVRDLEWGTDVSPEGRAKNFTHSFLLSFDDAAGRDAYLPHPAHTAFVARLEPLLDDVLVIDYQARGWA
ncbi:MAG: Dabb family protein [Burkholderiales bacterium]|nr:Dabb family protein [Burkholderiales bacterium]MDE2300553.1 Dabb family protein [Burkholderiales bacterium]